MAIAGQAEKVARSIYKRHDQAHALAQVTASLARVGQRDRAEAVARSITDPYEQANALAQVATALAVADDPVNARRMTAAAFAVGYWTIGAVPALTICPSAWTRIEPIRSSAASPSAPD